MEIYLVNNGSAYLADLKSALGDHSVKVVAPSEIVPKEAENFDAVVLSGGQPDSRSKMTDPQRKLVEITTRPILGICWGMQLHNFVFGGHGVEDMGYKRKGLIEIRRVVDDPLLECLDPNFWAYASHRLRVKGLSPFLRSLAGSEDGIEVIKHILKPIYGVQFHPEARVDGNQGAQVLANFLELAR